MSRDLPPELEAAIAEPVVRPFLAVRIELPDPALVWTGIGTLIFDDSDGNSREWQGAGAVGSMDTVGEETSGSATGVRVSLNAIPSDFRDDIADQAERGALFEVYAGALNETYQEIVAVKLIWKGTVNEYKITDAGSSLSVEITGESRAIDQRRPAIRRFTHEEQQRRSPGDLVFEYLPRMSEVQVIWGKQEQTGPFATGGGGGFAGYIPRVHQ